MAANMHKIFGILFWAFGADCSGGGSSERALVMKRGINCAWSHLTLLWQLSFSAPVFAEGTQSPPAGLEPELRHSQGRLQVLDSLWVCSSLWFMQNSIN